MLSLSVWPKMIKLRGFYCIRIASKSESPFKLTSQRHKFPIYSAFLQWSKKKLCFTHLLSSLIVGLGLGLNVFEHLAALLRMNISESLKLGSDFGQNMCRFGFGFLCDGFDFFDGLDDLCIHIVFEIGFFENQTFFSTFLLDCINEIWHWNVGQK